MHANVDCVVTWIASLRGLRWKHGAMQVAKRLPQIERYYATPNFVTFKRNRNSASLRYRYHVTLKFKHKF